MCHTGFLILNECSVPADTGRKSESQDEVATVSNRYGCSKQLEPVSLFMIGIRDSVLAFSAILCDASILFKDVIELT